LALLFHFLFEPSCGAAAAEIGLLFDSPFGAARNSGIPLHYCRGSERTAFGHTFALLAEVHSWRIVNVTQARRPVLRGDLNLKEVGEGRASPAVNLLPFETLAEDDFNSYRPLELTTIAQSSGKPS
jgi:hypothetical protein